MNINCIKVFVIDDHYLMIDGLYQLFDPDTHGIIVEGSSMTVEDAIRKIDDSKIDVIILDLFIKAFDPVTNFRLLHKTFPSLPICILSYEESVEWQVRMFNEGACAYLFKSLDRQIMRIAIHAVSKGFLLLNYELTAITTLMYKDNDTVRIDPEDRRIITDLFNGLTSKEVAQKRNVPKSMIDQTLLRLRKELGAKNTIHLFNILSNKKII